MLKQLSKTRPFVKAREVLSLESSLNRVPVIKEQNHGSGNERHMNK